MGFDGTVGALVAIELHDFRSEGFAIHIRSCSRSRPTRDSGTTLTAHASTPCFFVAHMDHDSLLKLMYSHKCPSYLLPAAAMYKARTQAAACDKRGTPASPSPKRHDYVHLISLLTVSGSPSSYKPLPWLRYNLQPLRTRPKQPLRRPTKPRQVLAWPRSLHHPLQWPSHQQSG